MAGAGAAFLAPPDAQEPERAYQALGTITETSAAALDELRATVYLLRQDDDLPPSLQPVPSVALLEGLIASFRDAGMNVSFSTEGTHNL